MKLFWKLRFFKVVNELCRTWYSLRNFEFLVSFCISFYLLMAGRRQFWQFLHIKLDRLISRSTCVESTQEENFTFEIFGLSFESYKRTITVQSYKTLNDEKYTKSQNDKHSMWHLIEDIRCASLTNTKKVFAMFI